MDNEAIFKKVDEVIEPALIHLGYSLVEREVISDLGRMVLRLYIDREGGVTIDDCERASRGIEDLIEVEDVMPTSFTLEVSSPGINRPIRKRDDFVKFAGKNVRLKTKKPIDGRSNYKGKLLGMDCDKIVMDVDGSEYKIPLEELLKARIEV